VWLDPEKTSPYRFYQFFINTEDSMVVEYLKKFTLLPREQIEALAAEHAKNPGARTAQKALAREVTALVHGTAARDDAVRASEIMFGGGLDGITEALFKDVAGEVPTKDLEKAKLAGAGTPLTELIVFAGLAPSKGQARKDVEAGGIYLNNVRVVRCEPRRHRGRPVVREIPSAPQRETLLRRAARGVGWRAAHGAGFFSGKGRPVLLVGAQSCCALRRNQGRNKIAPLLGCQTFRAS
jgi:tyrosyl-tRNA synthetase